jgi:hypothetical protein
MRMEFSVHTGAPRIHGELLTFGSDVAQMVYTLGPSTLLSITRVCESLGWRAAAAKAFGAKDVAVQIGDPLPSVRCDFKIADRALDMRRYEVPKEFRIAIYDVGRRIIAELFILPDFFEFVIKRVGFTQIIRIAKLADEIGGAYQHALFAVTLVKARRRRKTRELDGIGDAGGIEQLGLGQAIHHEQL